MMSNLKNRLLKLEIGRVRPGGFEVFIPMPVLSQDEWLVAHAWCEKTGAIFSREIIQARSWET